MNVNHGASKGGIIGIFFFFNMKVSCVFSIGSPHRGDSNEYKQFTFFNIEKKIIQKIIPNIMSAAMYHGIFS